MVLKFLKIPLAIKIKTENANGKLPKIIKEKMKECGSAARDCLISDKLTGKKKLFLSSIKYAAFIYP